VIDAAVWSGAPRESALGEEQALIDVAARGIDAHLEGLEEEVEPVTWSTQADPEHGGFGLMALTRRSGVEFRTPLDADFLRSSDFFHLLEFSERMLSTGAPPFRIRAENSEDEQVVNSAVELLDNLLKRGEKGLSIQRYKGLGEMNPDQLADTTMDADKRTLLQVRIPDMVEAEDAFTTLMGDDVEPRREFIERNALEVQNLDI
jgi:DNA gyrase subunit B